METTMRAIIPAILLMLPGCDALFTSAVGTWEGTCETEASGYSADFDFEIEIEEDKGGELSGEGSVEVYGYDADGDVEGERTSTEVEIELEAEFSGYSFDFELEGEIEGDDLSGDCQIGGLSGEFEAER